MRHSAPLLPGTEGAATGFASTSNECLREIRSVEKARTGKPSLEKTEPAAAKVAQPAANATDGSAPKTQLQSQERWYEGYRAGYFC